MLNDERLLDFFRSGFYERNWGHDFREPESRATAEKSVALLGATGGHILDWCGGWGRISRYLPPMGFKVTILDFNERYLTLAKQSFPKGAALTTICADCRATPSEIQADYALCSYNSVGFFPDDEQLRAFQSLHGALKRNGRVILDCMNLLFIARHFLPRIDSPRPDGTIFVRLNRLELLTSTLHTEFRLHDSAGKVVEERHFEQRLYTPHDLTGLLQAAGFRIKTMHGDFDGHDMNLDLPQIVVVAQNA